MGLKSYKTYERKFTAAGMAEEMYRLFYSLIKHKKPVEEYETGQVIIQSGSFNAL
jgi:hypothetical protein